MISNDEKALAALNTLIRVGRDAEKGFLAAADGVDDPELVQLFAESGLQRAKFVAELQGRVKVLRGEPEDAGTVAGELHRTWAGLKAAVESNAIHAILSECERGESLSVMAYGEALSERDLDAQTRELIQRQYEQVQACHGRVRQLRDRAALAGDN